MQAWLKKLHSPIPAELSSPAEIARFELDCALPDKQIELRLQPELGEGWRLDRREDRREDRGR